VAAVAWIVSSVDGHSYSDILTAPRRRVRAWLAPCWPWRAGCLKQ